MISIFQTAPSHIKRYCYSLLTLALLYTGGSNAEELTLRFETADTDLDTNKVYVLDDFAKQSGGLPKGFNNKYHIIDTVNSDLFKYEPQTRKVDFLFKQNTSLFKRFSEQILQPLQTQIPKFINDIESRKIPKLSSQKVQHLGIETDPFIINFAVRNSQVHVRMSGLSIAGKVKGRFSNDALKLFCGSSATISVSSNLVAEGIFDIASGKFKLHTIKANDKSSTRCSGVIGKILDPAFEFFIDGLIDEKISDFTSEVFAKFTDKQVGKNLLELITSEVQIAERILGIDVLEESLNALNRYVGGFNFEMKIGIDFLGKGHHMLGFSAYQDFVDANVDGSTANFKCPSWADEAIFYESTPVQISRNMRGKPATYGMKMVRVKSNSLNHSKKLYTTGRRGALPIREPRAIVGACKSHNNLRSLLRPLVLIPR